jgi:hypothetical protein
MAKFDKVDINTDLNIPVHTSNPASPKEGSLYYNSSDAQFKIYNGSNFAIIKGFKDGSTPGLAAKNATDIRELGITTNGVYWIDLPGAGPTQVYCNMEIDGGGWMMLAYAGSTSGVGNSNHMVFHQFGTLATSRSYGQTSFSRFDYAAGMESASVASMMMWKRTTDDNIMAHTMDEMWYRLPGNSKGGNMNFGGNSDLNYDITTMKMSNTGNNVLDIKLPTAGAGTRYENGPSYPAISWNSSYNNNQDSQGGYNVWLNRRALVYWETNGPESYGQWFHGSVLNMGDGGVGPNGSTSRKDVEIYFRVREPSV